ncbi:ankyrin repeat-containing domain protein [Xylaria acuta]|nr:ankyrin repeat-containing domain protein [Xylaria acuta]
MPESYSQENLQRAQSLLSGSREEHLYESLSIVIYRLSDNIHNLHREDEWQATMAIFKACGLFKISANLKNLKSSTIDGFIENLFRAAISRLTFLDPLVDDRELMTVLKWLLNLGQSQTILNEEFWATFFPEWLGACTSNEERYLELMGYILEAGYDANSMSFHDGEREVRPQTILEIVLTLNPSSDTVFRLAKLLLKHGASVHLDQALLWSIGRKKLERELIEMILQHGGNLSAELGCLSIFVHKATALSVAAATGLSETLYILDLLASRNRSKSISEFITAGVLISAASAGQYDTVCLLYSISGIVVANGYGITPLHAAAYHGDLNTCQLLFPLQAACVSDVTPMFSPLHVACYAGNQDVVHFLITKGANVNAVTRVCHTDEEQNACRFFSHHYFNFSLVSDSAPLEMVLKAIENHVYAEEAASCAIMLIKAGAELNGTEVVYYAASGLHLDLLSVALAAGADPNKKKAGGASALQSTCFPPRYDRLHNVGALLLQNGATLLGGEVMSAVCLVDRYLVDLFLRYDATLQGGEVIKAVRLNDWDLVDLLLRYGGSLLDTDTFGTVLEAAILSKAPISRLMPLLEAAPGNYDAGSLCAAIATGQNSIIQQLLTNRRTKSVAHYLEVTAIGMAAKSGDFVLLQSLLEHPLFCKFGPTLIIGTGSCSRITWSCRHLEYSPIDSWRYLWGSPLALLAGKEDDKAIKACSKLVKNGF